MIAGKEKIAEYFEGLLEKHGDHFLSLDWKSKESQLLRFLALLDITSFTDKKDKFSVLDVGCGIGHFYEFLQADGKLNKYTGIDISKKLIEFARNKYPSADLRVVDLIKDGLKGKYDYVFGCGTFSIRMADIEAHKASVRKMLSRMYDLSNHGVGVNFISRSVLYMMPPNDEESRYVYYTEEEVSQWVKAISSRFIIRRDYHPGDFTVYMLK